MVSYNETITPPDRARRIGLLTPFKELPGEYADVVADCAEPAVQWQVITAARDSHDLAEVRAMGAPDVLGDGLRRLSRWRPDAIMWACTCASFVLGRAGALKQCADLSRRAGVPVRSTSVALAAALRALGDDEVALLSPYPEPATNALVAFLDEWGIGTADVVWLDRPGATESEKLTAADVAPLIAELAGTARVVIPDTAVWGFELAAGLARQTSRPVLTANQVTLWLAFALAGLPATDARFGDLAGVTAPDPVGTR